MDIQQQRDPSLTHTKDQLTTTIGKLFEAIQIIIRKSLKITDSADELTEESLSISSMFLECNIQAIENKKNKSTQELMLYLLWVLNQSIHEFIQTFDLWIFLKQTNAASKIPQKEISEHKGENVTPDSEKNIGYYKNQVSKFRKVFKPLSFIIQKFEAKVHVDPYKDTTEDKATISYLTILFVDCFNFSDNMKLSMSALEQIQTVAFGTGLQWVDLSDTDDSSVILKQAKEIAMSFLRLDIPSFKNSLQILNYFDITYGELDKREEVQAVRVVHQEKVSKQAADTELQNRIQTAIEINLNPTGRRMPTETTSIDLQNPNEAIVKKRKIVDQNTENPVARFIEYSSSSEQEEEEQTDLQTDFKGDQQGEENDLDEEEKEEGLSSELGRSSGEKAKCLKEAVEAVLKVEITDRNKLLKEIDEEAFPKRVFLFPNNSIRDAITLETGAIGFRQSLIFSYDDRSVWKLAFIFIHEQKESECLETPKVYNQAYQRGAESGYMLEEALFGCVIDTDALIQSPIFEMLKEEITEESWRLIKEEMQKVVERKKEEERAMNIEENKSAKIPTRHRLRLYKAPISRFNLRLTCGPRYPAQFIQGLRQERLSVKDHFFEKLRKK